MTAVLRKSGEPEPGDGCCPRRARPGVAEAVLFPGASGKLVRIIGDIIGDALGIASNTAVSRDGSFAWA